MSSLAPQATHQSASPFRWITDENANTTAAVVNNKNFKGKMPLTKMDNSSMLRNLDKKLTHTVADNTLKQFSNYDSLKFQDANVKTLEATHTRKRNIVNSNYQFNSKGERDHLSNGQKSITETTYDFTPMVQEKGSMFTKVGGRSLQSSVKDRIQGVEARQENR